MVAASVILGAVGIFAIFACRPDGLLDCGRACALLAVFSLPWSAVEIHGIPIGDFPMFAGVVLLALTQIDQRFSLPAPVLGGGLLVGLAGAMSTVYSPSSSYLSGRYALNYVIVGTARSTGNLLSLGKYELALVGVPLLAVLACMHDKRIASRLTVAWVAGISVSALVAFSDYRGWTHVNESLVGFVNITHREGGLTAQPNNVGVQTAMAFPLLLLALLSGRRKPVIFLAGAIDALGVYVSGSRGASVGFAVATVLTVAFVPAARRWTPRIVAVVILAGSYLLISGAWTSLTTALRLHSSNATEASDQGRVNLLKQGWRDFTHSPLQGIGFGHASDAHMIFVQLLAAGGVLTLVGFGYFVIGLLVRANRIAGDKSLAQALTACTVTWLVIGLVENQLTDQWIYVPLALIAALIVASHDKGNSRRSEDDALIERNHAELAIVASMPRPAGPDILTVSAPRRVDVTPNHPNRQARHGPLSVLG